MLVGNPPVLRTIVTPVNVPPGFVHERLTYPSPATAAKALIAPTFAIGAALFIVADEKFGTSLYANSAKKTVVPFARPEIVCVPTEPGVPGTSIIVPSVGDVGEEPVLCTILVPIFAPDAECVQLRFNCPSRRWIVKWVGAPGVTDGVPVLVVPLLKFLVFPVLSAGNDTNA